MSVEVKWNTKEWDETLSKLYEISEEVLYDMGDVAVNSFKQNFTRQGFFNVNGWDKTEGKTKALIESGNLRRSIHIDIKTKDYVRIVSDTPYSEIHNEGGHIGITAKQVKYFWAMYEKTGLLKYKKMALSKKTFFDIPKRQFMGEHPNLTNRFEKLIKEYLDTLKKPNTDE